MSHDQGRRFLAGGAALFCSLPEKSDEKSRLRLCLLLGALVCERSKMTPAQAGSPRMKRNLVAWFFAHDRRGPCESLHSCSKGRVGFNPADEGFLWYGVQRTVAGEVPLRDFQSYEPARYYWCAAGALLLGQGLVAMRLSEAVAQAIELSGSVSWRLVDSRVTGSRLVRFRPHAAGLDVPFAQAL